MQKDNLNSEGFDYALVGPVAPINDVEIVDRVAESYKRATSQFDGHGESFWAGFEALHEDFSLAFKNDDRIELQRLLRNPSETDLFYGFDDLARSFQRATRPDAERHLIHMHHARMLREHLTRVATSIGAIRAFNPEAGIESTFMDIEYLLSALDEACGFKIDFPNPFPLELGLSTSRGVASYRAIHALYQAWRIKQITDHLHGAKVLEIGGGLGRNVYFARKFGIHNYTIVDIPKTQLAQGYYLGRIIGSNLISLDGEPEAPVRLRTPAWLHETEEDFDVIVNVDSLTEMDTSHALFYVEFSKNRSRALLSINHEHNANTASELFRTCKVDTLSRSPYYPRTGYFEEFALFDSDKRAAEIQSLREALTRAESVISEMKTSTSWRVTTPLRRVKEIAKRFN